MIGFPKLTVHTQAFDYQQALPRSPVSKAPLDLCMPRNSTINPTLARLSSFLVYNERGQAWLCRVRSVALFREILQDTREVIA